jgi:short-chain fatty acids transporter
MLERLGDSLSRWARRWVPDPFVLAILLTLVTFAASLFYVGFDVKRVLFAWVDGKGGGKGFWNLLAFGMQMCLILVTGHALASSPPVRRALDALAKSARTPARAVVVVTLGAMLLAYLNWGLGLIGGALLAREVGQRARKQGIPVHYPLLVAAGYSGLMVWHGGLSGSAPLKVTLAKDLKEILGESLAAQVQPMPLGQTIGSVGNLLANAILLVLVPLVLVRMLPAKEADRVPAPALDDEPEPAAPSGATPAERLERSSWLGFGFAAVGIATGVLLLRRQGLGNLDPNLLNFVFLFAGLALHGSPLAYVNAVAEAAKGCAGIILQFPFYAGIMGMLAGTGLLTAVAGAMAHVGPGALPAVSFYSAGLVNLFVPSGGGQWAVQGPILLEAAVKSGVSPARMVMALAYGDQWTNMLQPFWALPLLGITGARARDIIGYTAVILLVGQIGFLAALYVGW